MSAIDLWAHFLANEKLDPKYVQEDRVMDLIELCEALAKIRGPLVRPHAEKLKSRRFVVTVAMEMGLDLTSIKKKYESKPAIGRGLLDAWNAVYAEKFGSNFGTAGSKEVSRRNVKTRLSS